MYVEGLEFSEDKQWLLDQLQDAKVQAWLLAEPGVVTPNMLTEYGAVPFDFLKVDPGPQGNTRETLYFRKSLKVLAHETENCAFAYVLKFGDEGLTCDRMVYMVNMQTGEMACLIAVNNADGLMLRVSITSRERGYNEVQVFVAISQDYEAFSVVNKFVIDRDCNFCMMRDEPCQCDSILKSRVRAQQGRMVPGFSSPWQAARTFVNSLRGVSWVRISNQSRVRASTMCNMDTVHNRVQTWIWNVSSNLKELSASWDRRTMSLLSTSDSLPEVPAEGSQDGLFGSLPLSIKATQSKEEKSSVLVSASSPPEKKVEKKYKCDECDASFRTSSHRSRHKKGVHLREKRHRCPVCDKCFSQNSHLSNHIAILHSKKDKISCTICDATFSWKTNLFRHLRRQHAVSDELEHLEAS